MEALWPGMAPSEGRLRLRKLLHRLRTLYGPLVVREGDSLVLRADTDLADYQAALVTIAAYRNLQLAPDARYAEWADRVRPVAYSGWSECPHTA
jgi:DNA-binding SARP family transcriptional activator